VTTTVRFSEGLSFKEHLASEVRNKARERDFDMNDRPEVGLPDCRWTPCYDCGACTGYGIEHIVASATPPAGGSQGTGQLVFVR